EARVVDFHGAARRPDLILLQGAGEGARMGPRRDPVGGNGARPAGTRTGDVRAGSGTNREKGLVAGQEVEEDDDVTDPHAPIRVHVAALTRTRSATVGAGHAVLRLQQEQSVRYRD